MDVYTWEWEGDILRNINVSILPVKGFTNHRRRESFSKQMGEILVNKDYEAVVGFNQMPFLDVYFAGDICYIERARKGNLFYRMTPRYRSSLKSERAVYGKESKTHILKKSCWFFYDKNHPILNVKQKIIEK